jgi:LPS sulfotransferase NodH
MFNISLEKLIDTSQFHLINRITSSGILGGQSDYCRFIILGRGRTGSNFLRGLLNSHSQVFAFGELFRDRDSIGWEIPSYDRFLQNQQLVSFMNNDPVRFLEEKVFRKFPKRVSAVGFKLFYYHAQEDSRRVVWDFLRDQKSLKVIHIKRNNTLKMILSEKKAFKTDRWTNITGETEAKFSVTIDYEECLQRFSHEQQMQEEFDTYFSDHPKIELIYEDLSKEYTREMKHVQNFLGVNYESVQPSTYKQANQPLLEAIENYFELKESFLGTKWERFFEE